MPTISEPIYPLQQQSYNRLRQYYIQGLIGEATFRVSLSILGLKPRDIETEINLAKMEKQA